MGATATRRKAQKSTKFAWRDGSRFKISADIAGGELDRIKRNAGDLTPGVVVDAAAHPDNPLHGCFDWDDASAAGKHRLLQARQLINSVYVVVIRDEKPQPERPVYFSVKTEEEGRTYRTAVEIMSSEEAQASLLEEAKTVLKGFRVRYQHVKELCGVHAEIDKVTK
jgi:hypothetical protein